MLIKVFATIGIQVQELAPSKPLKRVRNGKVVTYPNRVRAGFYESHPMCGRRLLQYTNI